MWKQNIIVLDDQQIQHLFDALANYPWKYANSIIWIMQEQLSKTSNDSSESKKDLEKEAKIKQFAEKTS